MPNPQQPPPQPAKSGIPPAGSSPQHALGHPPSPPQQEEGQPSPVERMGKPTAKASPPEGKDKEKTADAEAKKKNLLRKAPTQELTGLLAKRRQEALDECSDEEVHAELERRAKGENV
jgi:hypothetical protein